MNQLFEALKSARKIEILILFATICVLLVLWMSGDGAGRMDSEETRMERILSRIEGAGRVSVMISQGSDGETEGVVVAASGADDLRVMLEIQRAVRTLTGLELDRIEIGRAKG